ncbi:hypothetical protein SISNIDRAFT_414427, partial [Sistotremastrum niveocremeum HHB9708]
TTNYLVIERVMTSIQGSWRIDTSKRMPSALFPKPEEGAKPKPHLSLQTVGAKINAHIELVADGRTQPRAIMRVSTVTGSIEIATSTLGQKFSLHCQGVNGSMTVLLPRSFAGPINTQKVMGKVKLSPEIQPLTFTFSERGDNGKYFLGDYESCGYGEEDTKTWDGDELSLETVNGDLSVWYVDEERPQAKKGFWKAVFGS